MLIEYVDTSPGYIDAIAYSTIGPTIKYPMIISQQGELCACAGFNYHGNCKHMDALKGLLEMMSINIKEVLNMEQIPDILPLKELECFNTLFGGIPLKEIFMVTGKPQTGKTIGLSQTLFDAMIQTKKNAIILDTEGALATHILPTWVDRWNDRFKSEIYVEHT